MRSIAYTVILSLSFSFETFSANTLHAFDSEIREGSSKVATITLRVEHLDHAYVCVYCSRRWHVMKKSRINHESGLPESSSFSAHHDQDQDWVVSL